MRRLLPLILFVLLGLLSACGGGSTNYSSGGSSSGGGTSADAQGTWSGSYTIAGSSSSSVIYAAINQDGYAFFYDQNGIIYVLPQFTGNGTLSGNLIAYAPAGTTFSSGLTQETFAVSATVTSTSITGSFTGNGATGNFTLTPYAPFNGNPGIVAGNWQGFYVGSGSSAAVAVTVQSGGIFVGTDSNGCTLNGTLSQIQSGQNLFAVSVDSSGSTCLGKLNGLAFESKADASGLFGGTTGTYYYVGVSNASGAFVAELKVQ